MFRYILNIFRRRLSVPLVKMKHPVLGVVLLLVGINFTVISKTKALDNKRTSSGIVLENSLLWKIEKDDRPTSYLFGTFHLLPLSDFEIADKVLTAFELTEQLILEVDLNDPLMQQKFMGHVTRSDTSTLENTLSSEDFGKLNAMLNRESGMDANMLNRWHPAMVGTFLINHFIEGDAASYDAALLELANNKNRESLGLETVEEQLSVFEKIPYQDQIKDLREMLNDEHKVKKIFSEMIARYKSEDIDGLLTLFLELANSKEKEELLLNNRNRKWIAKIDTFTESRSSFVAVGAGHLAGKNGLISLLRREGFVVTPLK